MSRAIDDRLPGRGAATLANWRTAPFSRWAFHHVREIVPSAAIDGAPNAPLALPDAPLPFDDCTVALPNGSTLGVDAFARATATDAMVILLDGRVVYERYDGGTTARTPHIVMSATKSVVGLLVGILQRNGALDVDALVSDYVPEVARTAYQGATLRHLLDMRAGVVLDDAQRRAYDAATGWEPVPLDDAASGLHAFLAHLTAPTGEHGGPFRYVSANTDLLGWAVERATGQPFASLLSTLLWQPMGAEDGAYLTLDRAGAPRCTGGLCATTRDLARLGQLVVENGRRGSVDVVPAAWIDDIATNGDPDAWDKGEFAAGFARMRMRYRGGWYVIDDAPQTLFAMGVHGQNLFVDRANRLVIAKVSSQDDPIDYAALALTHLAVPQIRRFVLGSAAKA